MSPAKMDATGPGARLEPRGAAPQMGETSPLSALAVCSLFAERYAARVRGRLGWRGLFWPEAARGACWDFCWRKAAGR